MLAYMENGASTYSIMNMLRTISSNRGRNNLKIILVLCIMVCVSSPELLVYHVQTQSPGTCAAHAHTSTQYERRVLRLKCTKAYTHTHSHTQRVNTARRSPQMRLLQIITAKGWKLVGWSRRRTPRSPQQCLLLLSGEMRIYIKLGSRAPIVMRIRVRAMGAGEIEYSQSP